MAYKRWASAENDSYGEFIGGIDKNEFDFGLSFMLLTIERLNFFSPLVPMNEFR